MSEKPQVVFVKEEGNALGLAGLIFSGLGWISCGLLSPIGALLSFLGLFSRGPKTTAIAGLVVGFPGVIFLGVFGLGFIATILGVGGAAIRKAADAKQQADIVAVNPPSNDATTEIDPEVLADQARIAEQKEVDDQKQRELEAAQKAQLEKEQAEQAIVTAREEKIQKELAEERRKTIKAVDYREWLSKDGKSKVTADLIKINESSVTLKRQDNEKEIDVPLDKLSKFDVDYVNNLR